MNNTWNVHPSQVQLRIANLWKGAFDRELLLQVDEEILDIIAAAVLQAAAMKNIVLSSRSHKPLSLCSPFKTGFRFQWRQWTTPVVWCHFMLEELLYLQTSWTESAGRSDAALLFLMQPFYNVSKLQHYSWLTTKWKKLLTSSLHRGLRQTGGCSWL